MSRPPFSIRSLGFDPCRQQAGNNRLCLDLGHKAIAAEKPHPRVQFLSLPDAQAVTHSEDIW